MNNFVGSFDTSASSQKGGAGVSASSAAEAASLAANEARVAELLDREWAMLIGGAQVPAASRATFDVLSPFSEELIARVPDGAAQDAASAVAAAHGAARSWGTIPATERARYVIELAAAIDGRIHDLALLDAVDGGAPINVMTGDVHFALGKLRYFAGLALEMKGHSTPASANLHFTERAPFGVVVRIIPFNHPILFAISSLAAPLVAGNTVVLKPSETTPLSALLLGQICGEVLPPGVVNIVVGDGPELPDALVRHPDVFRIGFTGSESVGRAIQRAAAETTVKTVTLELGGKNALVAYSDADPAEVAAGAVAGMNFTWSGQSCGSTSRLLVHRDIADDVLARIVSMVSDRVFVSPLDPIAVQGTIVNRRQYERVLGYIDAAVEEGATVLTGGPPEGVEVGLFIAPTVLDGVLPSHRVATEEIFGPVLSVLRWGDNDDPVELANSVRYGLTGSVFTNDIRRAHRVARALDTGYVWINGAGPHYTGVPFGGWKNSGTGHEESLDELLGYSRIKSVNVFL